MEKKHIVNCEMLEFPEEQKIHVIKFSRNLYGPSTPPPTIFKNAFQIATYHDK